MAERRREYSIETQQRLMGDHQAGKHRVFPVTGCMSCESSSPGEAQDVRTIPIGRLIAKILDKGPRPNQLADQDLSGRE